MSFRLHALKVTSGTQQKQTKRSSMTLDEAKTAIEERWDKWLAWADLSEAGGANVSEFRG
jgi:hypothetical protein